MVANVDCPAAPAARPGRLRLWWAMFQQRSADERALADLPDHLREDVGLDGGVRLCHFENGGRVFISGGRPDSTLSGWHW